MKLPFNVYRNDKLSLPDVLGVCRDDLTNREEEAVGEIDSSEEEAVSELDGRLSAMSG